MYKYLKMILMKKIISLQKLTHCTSQQYKPFPCHYLLKKFMILYSVHYNILYKE